MSDYLDRVWQARHFLCSLVRSDLRHRYRGSVIGVGWSLLHPLVMTGLVCGLFSSVFGVGPVEFAPQVFIGLAVWQFVTECTLTGCQSLRFAEGYIRQRPLPTAIYPLRTALSAGFHFVMALLLALVVTAVAQGTAPRACWLLLLPAGLVLLLLGWSVGTLAAFHTLRFADAPHLLQVGLQVLFYLTPVIYPARILHESGRTWVLDANPLYHLLEIFRSSLVGGGFPRIVSVVLVGTGTVVLALLAIATIWRQEKGVVFRL